MGPTTLTALLPTHLHTPRLRLDLFSPITHPQHHTCLLAALNSATAHATMGDFGVRTAAQFDAMNARARLKGERWAGGEAERDMYYLLRLREGSVDDGGEGELIGGVSLCQRAVSDEEGHEIVLPPDIGWCVCEEWMGKGYATEAAKEVLRFVLEEMGEKEVVVFRAEGNEASNQVAQKLGFVDGGQCPDLDHPGTMLSLYVLPGMPRLADTLTKGIGFGIHHQ